MEITPWMVIGFLLSSTNTTDQLSKHLRQDIREAGVGLVVRHTASWLKA